MTLQKVVVSCELNRQKSFNYGQLYVALSRATSLNGLHLKGPIDPNIFQANPKVTEHYETIRT